MGSSCAVADVQADKATIWSATQSAYPTRNTSAMLLGLKPESVRVIYVRGAGCYGINGADTVSYDAALLSQAVGTARPRATVAQGRNGVGELRQRLRDRSARRARCERQHQRVGLRGVVGRSRRPARLQHAGQRRHRIPRRLEPGAVCPTNACSGAGHTAQQRLRTPRRRTSPAAFGNRPTAPASFAASACCRIACCRHSSPGRCARPSDCRTPSRTNASWTKWRAHVKADPVEYRLKHLNHARLSAAVRAAAKAANWEQRPSPRPGRAAHG